MLSFQPLNRHSGESRNLRLLLSLPYWQITTLDSGLRRNDGKKVMKTTLEIDARLVQQLQELADRRNTTVSALAVAAIRNVLGDDAPAASDCPELPELPTFNSGGELVDISNREELYRFMDENDGQELPELPMWRGGELLVDVANREELYRVMDEYDGFRY